jgi:glutamyl-tRNA synthetase
MAVKSFTHYRACDWAAGAPVSEHEIDKVFIEYTDDELTGSFEVNWARIGGSITPSFQIFNDCWGMIGRMPELFDLMSRLHDEDTSPDDFVNKLLDLGYTDKTPRILPYNRPVVTRFAPSPTGDLHIGSARTALFNYMYARATGGKFLLRIEDTDKERSTKDSIRSIFSGLSRLGINDDADPVLQSDNAKRHASVVATLLANGHAYRDYSTPDETDEDKLKSKNAGTGFRSFYRDMEYEYNVPEPVGSPHVVRLKVPNDETIIIHDQIKGDVTFNSSHVDDIVLLRTDGTPTYNLAVAVDDHDMGVTHVIRGDDHLGNTPKQYMIYKLMGWAIPTFAHMPLINGPDGKKMSKRRDATDVSHYLEMGYLTEGLVNYLCHLSWSFGEQDVFPLDEAIAKFNITDVKSSPARFDFKKLDSINAEWMKMVDESRIVEWIDQRSTGVTNEIMDRIVRAVSVLKGKHSTLLSLKNDMEFIWSRGIEVADSSPLAGFSDALSLVIWEPDALQFAIKGFIEAKGLKMKDFGPALRVALTGAKSSPENHNVMYILGRDETLRRLLP